MEDVSLGARLFLEGDDDSSDGEMLGKLNPKKKIAEQVIKDLKLDENGNLVYSDNSWKIKVKDQAVIAEGMKNCQIS